MMYAQMIIKPHITTIGKYALRKAETNGYLNDLSPHQRNEAISMDEIFEILEFAIPVS